MTELIKLLKRLLRNIVLFCEHSSSIILRTYQEDVALTIVDSIINKKGLSFVVIFPRQSGKNELQAQIETYLLLLYSTSDAEMVKISPTWKPQSLNAMRRLQRVLERNLMTRNTWRKESGYIYKIGSARLTFLSGATTSNVVGATATVLLQCDEAQDVSIAKWDKEINPMAASTNATKIFWGTAWTSNTLLYREKILAMDKQKKDGKRRLFVIDADRVRKEVPAYGNFVDEEISKLGEGHPFVQTQYYSKEIDAEGGMFPPERISMMYGRHKRLDKPQDNKVYAFLIDVAGEDDAASILDITLGAATLTNPDRDATALTIVEIDISTVENDLIKAPSYLVRYRKLWVGEKHTILYAQLKALAELWDPTQIIIDATGVGAGLASFLDASFPGKVLPFIFSRKSKSDLGWQFISVIETGRYHDYKYKDKLQKEFWLQCQTTHMEIIPGPERRIRWSVPEGSRNPKTGELIHDDLVISASMCSLLDENIWGTSVSAVVDAYDPLNELTF